MNINHNFFNSKYAHEFKVIPILEEISNLDTDNLEKHFKTNFHTWMCIILDQYVKVVSLYHLKRLVDNYIDDGILYFKMRSTTEVGFLPYQQMVIDEVEELSSNEEMNELTIIKAKAYHDYLMQNEKRFLDLDEMIHMTSASRGKKSLEEPAKLMIKKLLIDIQLLNIAQKNLFYYLDRIHLFGLLYPNNDKIYIDDDFATLLEFDFDYYKNPPIYSEFPKEKKIYLKFLKSWLLEALETRKKILNLTEVPNAYIDLLAYANSLLPVEENEKTPELIAPVQSSSPPALMQTPQFPAHIFKTWEAFSLFQTFMEKYDTAAQIGFIYRVMAEKENPPLIHVKDTPFREWFNKESYTLKLVEHTKTYNNAANRDREQAYLIVKKLIISKS